MKVLRSFGVFVIMIMLANVCSADNLSGYGSGNNVWLDRGLDKFTLRKATANAAGYLVKNQLSDGQFVYMNDPLGMFSSKKKNSYSLIRHLGAVYSLIRAYQITGDIKYLNAAGDSQDFAARFAEKTDNIIVIKGITKKLSLGENGFFLINAALYNHLTGKDRYKNIVQGVVRFLKDNLKYDGPFSTSEQWAECQAAIGLAHYYKYTEHDPAILTIIHNWLKDIIKNGINTHWTVQAFNWYNLIAPETDYEFADCAIEGGKKLLENVVANTPESRPRMVGSRNNMFGSCGVTARNEGLIAAYTVALSEGDNADASFFKLQIQEHIAHALQFQYGFEGNFYENNKKMKLIARLFDLYGGVFNSPNQGYIRIDYVSHHIRAMAAYYLLDYEPAL